MQEDGLILHLPHSSALPFSSIRGVLPSEAAAEVIRIALQQLSYGLEPFKVQPVGGWS